MKTSKRIIKAVLTKLIKEARARRGPRQKVDLQMASQIVSSYASGDPAAEPKFQALYRVLAKANASPEMMGQYASDAASMYNASDDDFDEDGDSLIGSFEPEEYENMAIEELESIWAWLGQPYVELV